MPAKAAWMDVDLAEELTLTIGTGDVPVEIDTQIVMEHGVAVARLTATEHGAAVARLTAMEHGVAVATLIATEHGVAVARLTAMEHGVAVADKQVS